MRTKLDEIVDSMLPDYEGPQYREWLRGGLERAFRHGVEQCYQRDSDPYYLTVQPAPAEEKEVFHRTDKYQHVGTGTCCDRRKGERRRGREFKHPGPPCAAYVRMGKQWDGLPRNDRRSGKDRRK